MSEYEIHTDDCGEYRWRLTAENGEIVAHSSEGYTRQRDCENGLQNFRTAFDGETASQHSIEFSEDSAGEWRWNYVHRNSNVIATGEGYVGRYEAKRGVLTALFHATDPTTEITDSTK